jgi:hypothetical protein
MDYISVIKDSIATSVFMKIFKNSEDALLAHIFKSNLVKIPLYTFVDVENFNIDRLQKTAAEAYPLPNGRPRGDDDISSVIYYQTQIIQKKQITPIWMIQKNNKYILLDGAHRIVASYIQDVPDIYAYIIKI